MSTAVLCITDGRWECLERTVDSFERLVDGDVTERHLYVDSPDRGYREKVNRAYSDNGWRVFWHPEGRQGFAGAIHYAWKELLARSTADWVFHLEDDFEFQRGVLLYEMQNVLCENRQLAQMALQRQPWNSAEIEAGGVVALNREAFTLHRGVGREPSWLEHAMFWTTNPSLFRVELIDRFHWPLAPHSEGVFTHWLREVGYTFGYWGGFNEDPHVHHIGTARFGKGY